jgi:tetratricopeptide (TPR) repeat protein
MNGAVGAAREQVEQLWKSSPEFLVLQSDFPGIELKRDAAERLIADLRTSAGEPPTHFLLAALFRIAGEADKAHEHQVKLLGLLKQMEQKSATSLMPPEQLCHTHRYAACTQALASKPGLDAAEYLLLGNAHFAQRQFEAAADAFAASLPLTTNVAEVIYHLARSYQLLADECFSRVEELAPDSWRTHQMRAEVYKLRYEDDLAIREYQRAVQLRPDAPELYQELGELYLSRDSVDQALPPLQEALKLEPLQARTLYLLGQLYVVQREQEKAIPYLQKALRYDANLLEARATLGKAYLRMGRPQDAVAELEKARSIDFYGDLHYLLYQAYRDSGKVELARSALRQSEQMRKSSVARDKEKLERWMKND